MDTGMLFGVLLALCFLNVILAGIGGVLIRIAVALEKRVGR